MEPDDDVTDPLPGLIADLDQALKMASEVARMIRGHYDALRAEGFSERQAMYGAVAFIRGGEPPAS